MLVITLIIRRDGNRAIFVQERSGKDNIPFKIYKFRTMSPKNDVHDFKQEDIMTSFGKKLKNTSLDELPELINIIKGDMSIVGPRPLLVRYLDRYNEEQHHRHDVRPGLTGYAQAHGRNALSWEDKFKMDVWYTKNVTLKNDVNIILDTVKNVLSKEGISSENSATMEEFFGTVEGV